MADRMEESIIKVLGVAECFLSEGEVLMVQEYGNGNINDTYLVSVEVGDRFILQKINTRVFIQPRWIIHNMRTYINHVEDRIRLDQEKDLYRWELPRIRSTNGGRDYYEDAEGSFWRAIHFIPNSRSYDTVLDKQHANQAGYALGRFHFLVSDLNVSEMYDTLEGFHITPKYLDRYDEISIHESFSSPKDIYCQKIIADRRDWAIVLEAAHERGDLQYRIIHGDPKINNFMICNRTRQAISVIDLDTVKPGLVQYDIGDCLRSCCNPLGEETQNLDCVNFDIGLARAILDGYISAAHPFLTHHDYEYMWDAIRQITFELGLRFFTDHLAGNQYFKVRYEGHNLARAQVQFKLLESIEVMQ